jgi:Sec23/Sec24 trunk domain
MLLLRLCLSNAATTVIIYHANSWSSYGADRCNLQCAVTCVLQLQNKAVEFSKLQICVDLFLFGAQYTDVATLSQLPSKTGGQLCYYPGMCILIV